MTNFFDDPFKIGISSIFLAPLIRFSYRLNHPTFTPPPATSVSFFGMADAKARLMLDLGGPDNWNCSPFGLRLVMLAASRSIAVEKRSSSAPK